MESTTAKDVSKLENSINTTQNNIVKSYEYISKEQGLEELQQDEQIKEITNSITEESYNYLPNILIINTNTSNSKLLTKLTQKISNLNHVSLVELDEQYANKITNLIDFINNTSNLLLVFFGISLILVVYNLIRLQMLQNQAEITVTRLIGASDAFIMLPLIYYAVIQILISSTIAFCLINSFIAYINMLFMDMHTLFGKDFILPTLNASQIIQMLLTLIIFSIFAVFIAVQTVLKRYHPR